MHIGPHNVARAERGVVLERAAAARAVENRNQGFKRACAEVREIEGALERAIRWNCQGRPEASPPRA